MPKHEQPGSTGPNGLPNDTRKGARWQDMTHGPKKGQRQAKHARRLRVPGKGSGR